MKQIVRKYYGFQLFFNLLLWVPIFYEVQKKLGMSDPDIFGIQSIYYLAFIFFEIPTGFIADRWGYRNSMQLGAIAFLGANLLPILAPSYSGFLFHFLAIALSRSLISGAASAYLYDYLKSQGHEKDYKEIEGKARSLGLIGKVICWSLVGPMMRYSVYLPYAITSINGAIATIFAFLLPPNPKGKTKEQEGDTANTAQVANAAKEEKPSLKQAVQEIFHSPILMLLMLQGVGMFVLARINQVNLFQPILGSKSFDIEFYGGIMAIMTLCEAFGSSKSRILKEKFDDLKAVYIITMIVALTLTLTAISGQIGTILSFCLFSLAMGLGFPIQKQLLNDHIKGPSRATILSIESILDRSFSALAVLPLGGLIAAGELNTVLITATVIAMSGITFVYIAILKKQRKLGVAS